MPGIPVGEMAVRPGPFMAAYDIFDIRLRGIGSHAAMPHLGRDPIVAGAAIVTALQTIASRTIDPQDAVVVSVTQFHAGDTWNVVPEDLRIQGTVRSFRPAVQQAAEASLRRIVQGVCAAHGIEAVIDYDSRDPATINDDRAAELTAQVMADVVGPGSVRLDERPLMASEDFGVMLQKKPGAYVWLGNGPGEGGCLLHNPHYDFNDAALAIGASFWARLVETYEKRGASLAGG
jgi:hippurate hydrolase